MILYVCLFLIPLVSFVYNRELCFIHVLASGQNLNEVNDQNDDFVHKAILNILNKTL